MKSFFRAFVPWAALWATLSLLVWLLVDSHRGSGHSNLQLLVGVVTLPAISAWLTWRAVVALPANWFCRVAFWTGTIAGWFAVYLTFHAYVEMIAFVLRAEVVARDLLWNVGLSLVFLLIVAVWIA